MDKNYFLLGQLYSFFNNEYRSIRDLENFLEKKDYNLNYQIPRNSSAVKHTPRFLEYTFLHFAVEFKKQNFIELLLHYGADFTLKAGNGFTPLRLAIESNRDLTQKISSTSTSIYNGIPELGVLLSAHVESNNVTNPSCNNGISHFHIACLADYVPLVRLFLEAGASVNKCVNEASDMFPGFSPLHFAVRYGSKDLVDLLLTHGADINCMNRNGLTPLYLLIEQNVKINDYVLFERNGDYNTEIKYMLWRNDTFIDIFTNKSKHENNMIDDIGLSLFHVSCAMRDTTTSRRFLELETDVNQKVKCDSPIWAAYTPLHVAALCNPQIFKLLAKNGADILSKDAKGITPLDLFVQRYEPTDLCDVLNSHPVLGNIKFDNGAKLVDAVGSMEEENLFAEFVRHAGVNSRLPEDSPLWPGYTLTHLAVAMSRVTYRRHHNDYLKENYENIYDNDALARTCLFFDVNLNVQDIYGKTPLHLAFYSHKEKIVHLILQKILSNHAENCVDREGLFYLQIACIADNVELVGKFLNSSFDPDSPTRNDLTWRNSRRGSSLLIYKSGSTLYHIAAANNSEKMIDLICQSSAKMDLLDADGLTAVHVGFLNNSRWSTLRALLSISKTKTSNYAAENVGQLSHLHVACYAHDFASVENLATIASDIDEPIDCGMAKGSLYADKLAPYNGWTPLHFAVSESFDEAVDFLISMGANVCTKNAIGLNSLHLAVKNIVAENIIVRLYLEFKMNKEWPNDFGLTKLHVACIFDCKYEIESLLEAGEDVNSQINVDSPIRPGDTALHILMSWPDSFELRQKIKLLLRHGANLTLKNANNYTPLHLLKKDKKVVLLRNTLLEADSHFYESNPKNDEGISHFHISCMIGRKNIVKNFIDSGVNINETVCPFARLYKADTPLHLAVWYNNKDVIKLLLRHGADLRIENSRGRTPIQEAAISLKNSTMLEIIFEFNFEIDVQHENVFGETALRVLLTLDYGKSIFRKLLDSGIRINFVNPPAKKEDIARAAWLMDNDAFRTLVDRATDVTEIDVKGKNVVHSIGSLNVGSNPGTKFIPCTLNVKLWLDRGCDLNLRDKFGRTPLHDAASTGGAASKVLLLLGADVNIRDNRGRTAFSYLNSDNNTRRLFLNHILMMSCSGLDLDDSLDEMIKSEFVETSEARRNGNAILARMANVNITEDLNMRDLLTEKVVQNFPRFHVSKREIILDFLKPESLIQNHERRQSWNNLFQLQHRKILRRMKLLEPAVNFFYKRIYQLDLPCIELILQNLSNNDLENLIKI